LIDGDCYSSEEVRRVFVTSKVFNGAMLDPDSICNTEATAAGQPGSYKAWAPTKIMQQLSKPPKSRFDTTFNGPYVKINPHGIQDVPSDDFVLVAMGWHGLTTEDLRAPIDADEMGNPVTGYAWTAATRDGASNFLLHCQMWSKKNDTNVDFPLCEEKTSDYGSVGRIGDASTSWSYVSDFKCDADLLCCHMSIKWLDSYMLECDREHHLYCFQDG